MLKKLLKYDLVYIFKGVNVFYILSIFFALLTRIFLSIEGSFIFNVIGKICSGVTISMIFNIIINNLMRLWVRFKNNLYGDESYLTHTLPIKKSTLYKSKIISAFITLFVSVLVIGISLFIAYYSKENLMILKNVLLPIANAYGGTIMQIILAALFIIFLELANGLQAGYTGVILGHKMNNVKVGFSVLYGFIAYLLTQVFVLLILFICALFNSDLMNLFNTTQIINVDILKFVLVLSIITYTITIVIGYIVNIKLFNQGVNVD